MLRVFLCAALLCGSSVATAAEPFALRDGDVVAFVGNTFVEREQRDGYLELALTLAAPKADVTFRNLGWSGDTVDGRARRFFGPTAEGFKHLLDHLDLVKPTVIVVSYGTNEAFDGEAGRAAFLSGYEKLLDELAKRTPRIVLVTSPPLDPSASPAPKVAKQADDELQQQVGVVRDLAARRGFGFVDLFTPLSRLIQTGDAPGPLTDNGMHLTPLGYRVAARVMLDELGLSSGQWYEHLADAAKPLPETQEHLRELIVEKNTLFFHRHRPENETYLRGFRKHEQGNNAKEIYEFEPLAAEKDKEIFALRKTITGK
jgi:lysophospholipase L1-like esterase